MNAAKGRLRTIFHHGMFEPNEDLLTARCDCRKETLFDYEKHLFDIEVWPLEKMAAKTSINGLLMRLDKFGYHAKSSACANCRKDYKVIIERVIVRVRSYFDGLCLDCMDRSKPKLQDRDADYWNHNFLDEEEWSLGCRFSHGEPSWYFSFMGRKEDMDRFMKGKGHAGLRERA